MQDIFYCCFHLFIFFLIFLWKFDLPAPQLELQGVTSWGSTRSAPVSSSLQALPFVLPFLWWAEKCVRWKNKNCTVAGHSVCWLSASKVFHFLWICPFVCAITFQTKVTKRFKGGLKQSARLKKKTALISIIKFFKYHKNRHVNVVLVPQSQG